MRRNATVFVSYSQLCVFDSTLEEPFNAWSSEDVARYLVERERSVSFRTEIESGEYAVELTDTIDEEVRDDLLRRLETSSAIRFLGPIEVASISDGFRVVEEPPSSAKIRFEEFEGRKARITLLRACS